MATTHAVLQPLALSPRLLHGGLAFLREDSIRLSTRFGLFPFRSPLLWKSLLFSSPPGTEMVHFPGFALRTLCVQVTVTWFFQAGFPHSDIPGSRLVCSSPRLFAAYHVLHRLPVPRHPLYALRSLTIHLWCSVVSVQWSDHIGATGWSPLL